MQSVEDTPSENTGLWQPPDLSSINKSFRDIYFCPVITKNPVIPNFVNFPNQISFVSKNTNRNNVKKKI